MEAQDFSKMTKAELVAYMEQLEAAKLQAEQAAKAATQAAKAAEQRAEQAEQAAQAAKASRRQPAAPKSHAELLESDPAYLAGAIWSHVEHLDLTATEEGALNALTAHALKPESEFMTAGASRQNLSRARRAVTGYFAEQGKSEVKDIVFDALYSVPCLTVTAVGGYVGMDKVLAKSPRRLAESVGKAEAKLATAKQAVAAAETDKDKAAAEKAVAVAQEAVKEKQAALETAEESFTAWSENQEQAIKQAKAAKDTKEAAPEND